MAKSKSINVILNLKDKFTKPVQKTAKETKKFEREVKRVENNIKKSTSKMAKDFQDMTSKITKSAAKFTLKGIGTAAGLGIAGATAGIGAGISEGMDYETYKVQLETATKDTQKAAKLMKNAIEFANKTPFETGQVIEATAKFESMGLSAEKWLGITADMAGATSKDMIQAVEAVIDAVASGEFERLKEFGIKKDALAGFDKAGKMVDQTAMINSLMDIMQDRYKGGAESLSKTTKGMWSTVTGVFKNSMAKIVGIMDDGTVRSGSLLDRFKGYIQKVADTFLKWQQDATIEKIATKLDKMIVSAISGFKSFYNGVKKLIDSIRLFYLQIRESGELDAFISGLRIIAPIIVGIVAAQKLWTLGVKAWTFAMKLQTLWTNKAAVIQGTLNVVTGIWNKLAIANPWGIALTAIIAILLLVVANFDKVKAKVLELWNAWLPIWENIKTFTSDVITSIGDKFNSMINGLKEFVRGFANFFVEKINWCIEKLNGLLSFKMPKFLGGAEIGVNIPTIPEFATGTSYHRGGLARINENKRGEIVNLPNGTQVVPHDVSKKAATNKGGNTVTVPITIQGNVYGDADLVNRVGSMIAQRVTLAIGNV